LGLTTTRWREWHWNTDYDTMQNTERTSRCLRRSITSAQPYSLFYYISSENVEKPWLNLRVKNWVRKIVYCVHCTRVRRAMMALAPKRRRICQYSKFGQDRNPTLLCTRKHIKTWQGWWKTQAVHQLWMNCRLKMLTLTVYVHDYLTSLQNTKWHALNTHLSTT
jgi:hypothetical protein